MVDEIRSFLQQQAKLRGNSDLRVDVKQNHFGQLLAEISHPENKSDQKLAAGILRDVCGRYKLSIAAEAELGSTVSCRYAVVS